MLPNPYLFCGGIFPRGQHKPSVRGSCILLLLETILILEYFGFVHIYLYFKFHIALAMHTASLDTVLFSTSEIEPHPNTLSP